MPLHFSGVTAIHLEGGQSLHAQDAATGERVKVRASIEAIQDHGLGRVQSVASEKYDSEGIEAEGWVWVRTNDC